MAEFSIKTNGNSTPNRKPKVYFTCHPMDFEKSFEKISGDILDASDCAVYYTKDMTEELDGENISTDLKTMNLFVVPVTFRLLTEESRTMTVDIPLAFREHIPVLPLLMETGLDALYSKPDKFGELQYLDPFSNDMTAIKYEEKLKKFLSSILVNDETAKRIRDQFDAYIFLSYRKKDRKHANELMRLIHSNGKCRDLAIWYDEFLTPGESFNENIEKMLNLSKLFTMVVTQNLLEEPDGKPNFVMANEYPAAKRLGMNIFPAKMEATDIEELNIKYPSIPDCIDAHDKTSFDERLIEAVSSISFTDNDDDPEHIYLIGLAYLTGTDVELDRERGMELITQAAELGNSEAMAKLKDIYREGTGVRINYIEAKKWAERLKDHNIETLGKENKDTIASINDVAMLCASTGDLDKAETTAEEAYKYAKEYIGSRDEATRIILSNLAGIYLRRGELRKMKEMLEGSDVAFDGAPEDADTGSIAMLLNLGRLYSAMGEYNEALNHQEKAESFARHLWGDEDHQTLMLLCDKALTYDKMGRFKEAIELQEYVYDKLTKKLGEDHPDTLHSLGNLALSYNNSGDHEKALEPSITVYEKRKQIYGERHPSTLIAHSNLAIVYNDLKDHGKAEEINKKVYEIRLSYLGKSIPRPYFRWEIFPQYI